MLNREPARRPITSRIMTRITAILSAVGIVLASLIAASPASAAGICDFAVFIGVRGTDAPAGASSTHSGRVWTDGGMGPQIDQLITDYQQLGYPTYFESLNYPAAGGVNYASSVTTGVNSLVAELNWLSTQCSHLPAVILAGHSQGAQVILDALGWAAFPSGPHLTDSAKNMVRAAAVFGDPTYLPNQPYNDPYVHAPHNGLFPRNLTVAGWLAQDYSFQGWPMGANGPGTVYKIRSWCFSGDYFCQADFSDSNYTIHNSYIDLTMTQARDWIDFLLADNG